MEEEEATGVAFAVEEERVEEETTGVAFVVEREEREEVR